MECWSTEVLLGFQFSTTPILQFWRTDDAQMGANTPDTHY